MGEATKIQWCDHTFNPWRGCTKVSAGCKFCYAEAMSGRNPGVLGVWGDDGTRVVAAESYWRQPFKWDREAKAAGERRRVFCASLGDVFEQNDWLVEPRRRLFGVIAETPHLDWLLLTKRPHVAAEWLPKMVRDIRDTLLAYGRNRPLPNKDHLLLDSLVDSGVFPNVWLGTSVEDQAAANRRIPDLLEIPAAVRFVSAEPLLGPVNLVDAHAYGYAWDYLRGERWSAAHATRVRGLDWVIGGGESGPNARPFNLQWARDLRDQCREAGVAFFMKQLGSKPQEPVRGPEFGLPEGATPKGYAWRMDLRDKKGGDMTEWPEDLRVRELPR